MRLMLVVPGGVHRSGREQVIPALLWLMEQLSRRHQVTVVALRQSPAPDSYRLRGCRVEVLAPAAGRGRRTWRRLRQLRRLLDEDGARPQLVHGFWLGESGLLAGLLGRWLRLPVVASLGGVERIWLPQIRHGGRGRPAERLRVAGTLRLAHVLTAGSRLAAATLGRPGVRRVPLGVDVSLFDGASPPQDGPPWRVLHVGDINPVKDQATLLRALRRAARRIPDLRLDWAGRDTLGGQLQRAALELGLEDRVRFHGSLPTDRLLPLYRRAHLHLQSSLYESQGVALLEAAAAGLPTLGTAVGLLPELAPRAALAVPVGDAAALGRGIVGLLSDRPRRLAMGQAARRWARAHDAAWTAARFEEIYRELGAR